MGSDIIPEKLNTVRIVKTVVSHTVDKDKCRSRKRDRLFHRGGGSIQNGKLLGCICPVHSTDTPVGKASVYYVDNKSGEKQVLAEVNLVPVENIDRSGILAVLDVIGTIFRSYWFIVVILVIILAVAGYVIASKIHRAKMRKRRKVKKYRNF